MGDFKSFLEKVRFEKQLEKLEKKTRNQRVLIYGAGFLFEEINKYYDLKALNIIGIADKNKVTGEIEKLYGYKAVKVTDIKDIQPDVILVSLMNSIYIVETLALEHKNATVLPLVNKGRKAFLEEILRI